MKQAVLNVIINAEDAMPEGGDLMVRTARSKDQARIDIADTGIGMSPEVMENIFRAYYSKKKRGTGLGLAPAKRIVEEHRGAISVQSDEAKGSNFTILIPVAEAREG